MYVELRKTFAMHVLCRVFPWQWVVCLVKFVPVRLNCLSLWQQLMAFVALKSICKLACLPEQSCKNIPYCIFNTMALSVSLNCLLMAQHCQLLSTWQCVQVECICTSMPLREERSSKDISYKENGKGTMTWVCQARAPTKALRGEAHPACSHSCPAKPRA